MAELEGTKRGGGARCSSFYLLDLARFKKHKRGRWGPSLSKKGMVIGATLYTHLLYVIRTYGGLLTLGMMLWLSWEA